MLSPRPAELLAQKAHRPWPLPTGPWIMRQTWSRLLFMHWPVPVDVLRPLVPAGLDIETYEGTAWLGVVPFLMGSVRPRVFGGVASLSPFPELNVRTYVTASGKPGVWFFSLDAENALAVAGARLFFHLPYYHAEFSVIEQGKSTSYNSARTHYSSRTERPGFAAEYEPTGPIGLSRPGSLDAFLTERYCLYSADRRGKLFRSEIHHRQWPLQPAQCEITRNTMAQAAGVTRPETAPVLHYTERLDVLVWPLSRLTPREAPRER